jgi:hypothetical protein
MSGAFGALGGDLSAININPAGSTVFNNNQVGITLSTNSNRNNTNYFNSCSRWNKIRDKFLHNHKEKNTENSFNHSF